MTQKQRKEIESIYWDLTRSQRKLAAILEVEEKKWSNLGDGSGVLLECAPVGRKIDSETINLDEATRALDTGLTGLKLMIKCLELARLQLDELRPQK